MQRSWLLCLAVVLSSPALPSPASAQDLSTIPRVVLAERVPAGWLTNSADRMLLEPARQRRRLPRQCQTRGGYRQFCSGERRIPAAFGPALAFAQHLGLGVRATAMRMLHYPPFAEWLAAVDSSDADPHLTFPVPAGYLGRGFGYTRDAGLRHRRHEGVDIGAPEGSPIVAARGGLVVYADNGITGMGNALIVLHRGGHSTLYAHCRAIHVFAGQYVSRGQLIAEVGETGFANAPHLHFEWRRSGWVRDPARQFLRNRADGSFVRVEPSGRSVQLASAVRIPTGSRLSAR